MKVRIKSPQTKSIEPATISVPHKIHMGARPNNARIAPALAPKNNKLQKTVPITSPKEWRFLRDFLQVRFFVFAFLLTLDVSLESITSLYCEDTSALLEDGNPSTEANDELLNPTRDRISVIWSKILTMIKVFLKLTNYPDKQAQSQ